MLSFLPTVIAMGFDPISLIVGAVVLASSAVAYTGVRKAQKEAERAARSAAEATARSRGLLAQIRASAHHRRIVYGERRLGGLEAYVTAGGADNQYLHYILIWSDGPNKSVKTLLLNGVAVHMVPIDGDNPTIFVPAAGSPYFGHIRWESEMGTPGQPPRGQGIIPGWAATNLFEGICYSWVEFLYDENIFKDGLPEISAVIEGRNDMVHPLADTLQYSTNVAVCLNHYLTLQRLGPGCSDDEIDQADYEQCAVDCAELLETSDPQEEDSNDTNDSNDSNDSNGTNIPAQPSMERRYSFNGVVSLENDPEQIINTFRMAMAGVVTYIGGRWRMYAGVYQTPSFEITKDMFVSGYELQNKVPRNSKFNTVKGTYVSPFTNWQPTSYRDYTEEAFLAEDQGEELVEEISLENTDTHSACQRIASIFLRRSRMSRTIQVHCNVEALEAVPGRNVLLHLPEEQYEHQPMEVLDYGFSIADNQITITLLLKQTGPSVYSLTGEQASLFGPPVIVPPGGGGFVFPPRPGYVARTGKTTYEEVLDDSGVSLPINNVPASGECRSKTGEGCFCGIKEFEPSTPARYYKVRNTVGNMYIGEFPTNVCGTECGGGNPNTLVLAVDGAHQPSYGNFNIGFTLSLLADNEDGTWDLVVSGGYCNNASTGDPWTWRVIVSWTNPLGASVGRIYTGNGPVDSGPAAVPSCSRTDLIQSILDGRLSVTMFVLGFAGYQAFFADASDLGFEVPGNGYAISTIRDTWAIEDDYNPGMEATNPVCAPTTDYAATGRFTGLGAFPLTVGGDEELPRPDLFGLAPPTAYGDRVIVTTNPTTRTTDGDEVCQPLFHPFESEPYAWRKYQGSVVESLTDEDTEEDLLDRVFGASILDIPNEDLDPLATCYVYDTCCTALFLVNEENGCALIREVKARGFVSPVHVTEGVEYRIRLVYGRRPVADGDYPDYAFDEVVIEATADQAANGIYTPYFRIPNDQGFETRLIRVECEEVDA